MDSSMFEGEKKIRRRLSPFRACWTFLEQKPTCCRLIRHYCSVAIFLSMTNNHGIHIHGVGWAIC